MGAVQSARAQELSAHPRQGGGLVQEKVGGKAPFVCLLTVDVYFLEFMRNMKQFKKPFKNYCKRKDQRKKKRNLKEKNMFIDPIQYTEFSTSTYSPASSSRNRRRYPRLLPPF